MNVFIILYDPVIPKLLTVGAVCDSVPYSIMYFDSTLSPTGGPSGSDTQH